MRLLRHLLLHALLLLLALPALAGTGPDSDAFWHGQAADGGPSVHLYYFYTPTCPHCRAAAPFLDELAGRLPWLDLRKFSVMNDADNAWFYFNTAQALGVEARSVPGFVFCRQVQIGFDTAETTGAELERALVACREQRMPQAPAAAAPSAPAAVAAASAVEPGALVNLPLVGSLDARTLSLPVLTLVLAGVDAFNPCAFFVLLFLLSMLTHARDRRRMLIVGLTFVLLSGLMYFVFMAAWLNVFLLLDELRAVTVAAGLLALGMGVVNVKDYVWFRRGISLSIPETAKPGLFRRMRSIVATGSLGPMLVSTVLLAIAANAYELLCTAAFPMVYTRTLTLADLPTSHYYAWLAAYNVIYVLPLVVIVLLFVRTLGARKLAEDEGRVLKLLSGLMMLGFGALLLGAPELLGNALAAIAVLLVAILVCAVIVGVWGKPRQL